MFCRRDEDITESIVENEGFVNSEDTADNEAFAKREDTAEDVGPVVSCNW